MGSAFETLARKEEVVGDSARFRHIFHFGVHGSEFFRNGFASQGSLRAVPGS
jgi:hypothetical protein